ncbi:hypothetical protein EUTSA_v10019614mg, partial [Eutrema salsugineum]
TSSEASSSKSKVIDQFIRMGFPEESVIKAIQDYGEENIDEITNTLLNYAEAESTNNNSNLSDNNGDSNHYSGLSSSDEENEINYPHEEGRLQALIKMGYPREEASIAIERCGENAGVAEVVDFIFAAQMAREFDEFYAEPYEPIINSNKRRACSEPPTRRRIPNTAMASDEELIRLPNPMIGFGVPNEPGLMTQRPVPLPDVARGPPYFYYENVAIAPKGVWAKISSKLYGIKPEFVDSQYFCAAARKRGYIHKALPWAERCAQMTNKIRKVLEKDDKNLFVQKEIIEQCKRWNLVWVGKNKVAPLEPDEIEKLLGFPKDHTRGGGITKTDRYKSLGNSFQVDTVAYHLSVLKHLFPKGIKVLSLFSGIGGGEVALRRLQIPMKVIVSVEISEVNRNILRSFWEETKQMGDVLIEFKDVQALDDHKIEELMDHYGGFDLVIGGSPCNNLAGANRVSRTGLEGDQSSLFFEFCRILDVVRRKAARMRR